MQALSNVYDFKKYNLYTDSTDKYNFITHFLYPNNINIFQSYIDNDYVLKYPQNFLIAIYPVYKLYWKNLFICYNQNKNIIYLDNQDIYSTSIEIVNDFLIGGIYINTNNNIIIKSNKSTITYSAYAYATILYNIPIRLGDLNNNQILGIVESSNILGILSDNKNVKFPKFINNINLEKSILFRLSESNLRSTHPDIQLKLFDLFINRLNSIVSGGTGTGKTSIVPKIIWWFNFLFDGYNMFNNKINNLNVSNFIFDTDINQRNVLLSLPRKAIINSTAVNYIKSLGYNNISGTPVIIKYKDIKLYKEYYNNKSNFYTNLLLCVNRLSINNLKKSSVVIIDEIHEHNRYADICIAVSYFLKKKLNIRNIILISATIEYEIENILRFFKNKIINIYIPGITLFNVIEIENLSDSVDKLLLENSPPVGYSAIIFCETVNKIINIKTYLENIITNPIYKFYAIHGKVENISDILHKIETNKKYIHVIISTNYLESSITISNAKLVIDNGKEYRKEFIDGKITYITESMYKQRKGRVGRVSRGIYIRTYTKNNLNTNFKHINYQYLWDYILIFKYYRLNIKTDYFVIPDNLDRIDKTVDYMKSIGIDIDKNINNIYRIFNKYEINMLEYFIIYLYGTDSEISLLNTYDKNELEIPLKLYNLYIKMNVKLKLISKYKNNITFIFSFVNNVYDGPQFFKFNTSDKTIIFDKNKIFYMKSENPLIIMSS
ncbi:RNA helicase, DExH-NPH-II domain [Adoxophyes honmai entomopoxvirus 'L']|uniref:RNA helicase NPH-II n=1 Tax=Adoxophyes honmai entomopoxvirus 'L' TaxID=1293540 RepID=A0A916KP01_9POXV|nr:RNA helicase, DExH-NPH-II domain [Adoxophyes honmai entomopoxvirus 'L']CCU55400.1 RNA helicase, DExH-NPH-II domain [Adoxophyes honmai entomopoxvirus 'L']